MTCHFSLSCPCLLANRQGLKEMAAGLPLQIVDLVDEEHLYIATLQVRGVHPHRFSCVWAQQGNSES